MSEKVTAIDRLNAELVRGGGTNENATITGIYDIEVVRDGEVIHRSTHKNTVTTEGKRYLLDAALDNSAAGYAEQVAWYVALVSTNTAAAATYVYDTFLDGTTVPATEFVSYSGGARKDWAGVLDAGGAASITNSASRASFGITGSGTLYGACLVSNPTLSDHTAGDYLFSYSLFSSSIAVVNTDTVNVTVTIALS